MEKKNWNSWSMDSRKAKGVAAKRFLGIALCLSLSLGLLSGCGKGDSKETGNATMGRYVEQQVATVENADQAMGLCLGENGDLVFYTAGSADGGASLNRCVLSAESGEFTQTSMTWAKDLGNILDISEAGDGTTYLVAADENFKTSVYQIKDQKAEAVDVPGLSQTESADGSQLCGVRSLPGGDFLLLFGAAGASCYSGVDASPQKEYAITGYNWSVSIHNGKMLAPGMGKNELLVFNLDSGAQEQTVTFDTLSLSSCQGMDDSGVYVADMTGIYRQIAGSSDWDRVVEGDLTSLSLPSALLGGVVSDGTDGFFAILSAADGVKLMHYVYDPDIPAVPDTTLTIFGLKDNSTIRQAIGAFQQQNPNVRIDFRIASEGAASANTEDIIRTLNTELLNGNGPDILLLDGLPVNSYMEKGVLTDLTDGINTMAEGGILENIAKAYEYEGHCYGIPSRFTIPAMAGEQSALDSVRSLEELADFTENSGNGGAPFLTPSNNLYGEEGMMMDYYEDCSSDFVESGKIDEAALTKYFTDMLRIQKAQESNFMETDIGVVDGRIVLFELMGFMESEEDLFYVQEIKGYNATNVILFGLSGSGMSAEHGLMPVFGESFYTPRQAVGITSASEQQELALQFVNLLLSQTVQDVYLYDGFPVNSRSLDKLVEDAIKNKENSTKFREMCGQLNTPIFVDQVVREAVQSQMKGLLDGTLTAESAAAAVMEKIELYLKE